MAVNLKHGSRLIPQKILVLNRDGGFSPFSAISIIIHKYLKCFFLSMSRFSWKFDKPTGIFPRIPRLSRLIDHEPGIHNSYTILTHSPIRDP